MQKLNYKTSKDYDLLTTIMKTERVVCFYGIGKKLKCNITEYDTEDNKTRYAIGRDIQGYDEHSFKVYCEMSNVKFIVPEVKSENNN